MSTATYYTATSLDGFIADPDDSLSWLFAQATDDDGPLGHDAFLTAIGACVMGSTSYEWLRAHLAETGEDWPFTIPAWVMTSRDLDGIDGADIRFAAGPPGPVHAAMVDAADGRDLWVMGGGDLAGQWADAGLLDEVIAFLAPVTLGAGRPLLPRRLQLAVEEQGRSGDFLCARYRVVGPGDWSAAQAPPVAPA